MHETLAWISNPADFRCPQSLPFSFTQHQVSKWLFTMIRKTFLHHPLPDSNLSPIFASSFLREGGSHQWQILWATQTQPVSTGQIFHREPGDWGQDTWKPNVALLLLLDSEHRAFIESSWPVLYVRLLKRCFVFSIHLFSETIFSPNTLTYLTRISCAHSE